MKCPKNFVRSNRWLNGWTVHTRLLTDLRMVLITSTVPTMTWLSGLPTITFSGLINMLAIKSWMRLRCSKMRTICRASGSFSFFLDNRRSWIFRTRYQHNGAEPLSGEAWNNGTKFRYAAKVTWHKVHGWSFLQRKGATAPFSCLPARTGSGRARSWVKGLVPCGYIGQSPMPLESSSINICSFQGSFEPIFSAQFFHTSLDTIWQPGVFF